jgi:hypothetical protein
VKKSLVFLAVVSVGVSFAIPGQAIAPPDQYAFFTSGDVRITDNYTHLVWDRAGSAAYSATNLIEGYCVWPSRLPTVKELLTLVDEEPNLRYDQTQGKNVTYYTDPEVFPDIAVDAPYCTQTFVVGGANRFTVDFANGKAAADGRACHVRCVHYVGP